MPYDIDYRRLPDGGALLETQYGVGNAAGGGGGSYSGSMSGSLPGMPDMTAFYQAMAAKQAEAENYKRQQQADAIARQKEAQSYERNQRENALDRERRQTSRAENMENMFKDQAQHQLGIAQTQKVAQRWMKNLPGIGPVEVAPGTFGAYAAGNIDAPTDERAASAGLRPGLVGTSFSYLPGSGGGSADPKSAKAKNDEDQASADQIAASADEMQRRTRAAKAGWGV